ncbi:flavohemoglobin expression-modulating QEGLA motif protein [Janibacter terrae]|uniref:flavohemoglobin expression-modulating QEGLA motif protein n=1 Tax=Janibacter terrae TaxID=103817 RepID=UPI000835534D|nr:tyrosine/phenylalanine carboxypeptidase domain-containing protein [Janibacter terrae]
MSEDAAALRRVSVNDLAIDHALAQMSGSMRFLLDVTPVNADDIKAEFVAGRVSEPRFVYRELEADQEVLKQVVTNIDVSQVEDTTLASLLRAKHRELLLQIDMLMARDSDVFRQLSTELYGGTSPRLREQAENILAAVPTPETKGEGVTAEEFLGLAQAEIDHYTGIDPGIDIHAEVRDDVNGVVVSGNTLLIDPDATVQRARADALLQHEVGTHLVTQVNGSAQPIQVLGTGLAGYDETQEGLAVLAEIGCGGLTPFRLRQLAARVVTVHRMTGGSSFVEAWEGLVDAGFPEASAFTTTMRAYRSGGLTKDAIYLRGLVDLLDHLRGGGTLDRLWLGKFSLDDLPLIDSLDEAGILNPPRILPRWLDDPSTADRLAAAAECSDDVTRLLPPSVHA